MAPQTREHVYNISIGKVKFKKKVESMYLGVCIFYYKILDSYVFLNMNVLKNI